MKFNCIPILIVFFVNTVSGQIIYPKTIKKSVIENFHGKEIIDEYRWLESQENDSVIDWIDGQNKISKRYLKKLTRSNKTDEQMNKYLFSDLGDYDGKIKKESKDKYYFTYFVEGSNSTPSLYYKKGINSSYNILVNSTAISTRDKIDIDYFNVSKNNTLLAYKYSRNGSDWHEIRVVKIDKKRHYQNVLRHTRSSAVYWWNDGFFYKKYPFDSVNAVYKRPTIMYHKVETKQADDKLMFKSYSDDEDVTIIGTKKEDFYIIKRENTKTEIYNYYLFNPSSNKLSFKPFLINTKYDLSFNRIKDSLLFATTRINGKKQFLSINVNEPKKFNLISPAYNEHELQDIEMLDDFIVASYYSVKGSFLAKIDYEGKVLNETILPKGLSVSNIGYNENYEEFFFYLSSYTIPHVLYKLDLETFNYDLVGATDVNFDFKSYRFKQDYYTSHDGVKVPIFMVFKDSLKKDKSTPFLLKTYGGYGTTNIPHFNPGIVYFIENGGAFAYVDIRGSGGLGEEWVKDGQRLKKKNGIKDFISAAEFLIDKQYTSSKKIAITGTSHGGLVVGAALTQRPELFGSAVIDVGALDMLRFEQFTVGSSIGNIKEYGSVKNIEDFNNLLSYSPYQNIKTSIDYPSILLVTGKHDNRVPPLHSYKFTAKVQSNPYQTNPVLLWSQNKVGHSGAFTNAGLLEEFVFIYGFLFHQLEGNK
ncbi:prolyl oligopeptidase family serine peptidase [Algibacter sp. R77976]|uniref:prolyl oligopeptidase family serine peptidase n=1 Tax=Algibacter sp. R77976 TaxID=3093873 RepID=UPI0037CA5013